MKEFLAPAPNVITPKSAFAIILFSPAPSPPNILSLQFPPLNSTPIPDPRLIVPEVSVPI